MADERYADSITFTIGQLDDLLACVDLAIAQGVNGFKWNTLEELRPLEENRKQLRAMLARFQQAAKKRADRRTKP